MILAHDIFAETNPAFCAAVLARFCEAYSSEAGRNAGLPITYLVLPIVLSEDLATTFATCNKATGLLVWLERSPRIFDGLASRVNHTLHLTTNAVRFGCISGMLHMDSESCIRSAKTKIPSSAVAFSLGDVFKRARLLGCWFAGTGSERAVIEAMGVSV